MAANMTPVKPTGDSIVELSFRVIPTEGKEVGLCVSRSARHWPWNTVGTRRTLSQEISGAEGDSQRGTWREPPAASWGWG